MCSRSAQNSRCLTWWSITPARKDRERERQRKFLRKREEAGSAIREASSFLLRCADCLSGNGTKPARPSSHFSLISLLPLFRLKVFPDPLFCQTTKLSSTTYYYCASLIWHNLFSGEKTAWGKIPDREAHIGHFCGSP